VTEMKTSEVLDLAADVIEQRGWTIGTWNNTMENAPVCIEGGIAAALGITIDLGGTPDDGVYTCFTTCPAYVAVQDYLGVNALLYSWNDDLTAVARWEDGAIVEPPQYAHTQAEVIETLRAAAAVERAKEESLEGSEVTA